MQGWSGSCRGGVGHAGVGWGEPCRGGVGYVAAGWVMQEWGELCRSGMGYVGVGCVIQGWGRLCGSLSHCKRLNWKKLLHNFICHLSFLKKLSPTHTPPLISICEFLKPYNLLFLKFESFVKG